MKRLAIIPARGGSKRIPRKNIKSFLGKPILSYSIEAAIDSGLFDKVIVSTDDTEIAEVGKRFGAKVPFLRSKHNADDYATTFDVIKEVIFEFGNIGETFDEACCIYPSAPFVTKKMLTDFYNFFKESNFDCVFPALRYSYPIQRALKIDTDGKMSMFNPEHIETRSQDLEFSYHDAGQFYWFNVQKLLNYGKLWTENTGVKVITEMQAQDIDTIEDWEIAEFKYKFNQKLK